MPKMYPVQTSFAAGELSRKMGGRVDTAGYNNAWQYGENMISDPRGPAYRRGGGRYLFTVPTDGDIRLFNFHDHEYEAFTVALTNQKLDVGFPADIRYKAENLVNSNFTGGVAGWNITQGPNTSIDEERWCEKIQITPGRSPGESVKLWQTFLPKEFSTQRFRFLGLLKGASAASGTKFQIGTTGVDSEDIFSLDLYNGQAAYEDSTIVFPVVANPFTITITINPNDMGDEERACILDTVSIVKFDNISIPVGSFATPWFDSQLAQVQARMHPYLREMWFTHPTEGYKKLRFDPATGPFWFFEDIGFTAVPPEWLSGNFPITFDFFQGRVWFGGTPAQPEQWWASESGDFLNMLPPGSPTESSPFTKTLDSQGEIKWIRGAKNLLLGTENGEYIITSQSGVISAQDTEVEQQSAYGSRDVVPELIGNEVLYISPDGRKLRSMTYQWEDQGWLSKDITFTNDHMTNGIVKDIAFTRNPDDIVWLVLEDGRMIGCSYHKSGTNIIYGWHRHRTVGAFRSISVAQVFGNGITVTATTREIGGSVQAYVEAIDPDIFLDSFIDQIFNTATDVVTGLDHLEGQIVQAIVDDAVQPELYTVSGGQITVRDTGNRHIVGLPGSAEFVTLPMSSAMGGGQSTISWRKNRSRILLRLLDSSIPKVNGRRPSERLYSTPMNIPEPNCSFDVEALGEGWDDHAQVEVVQDLPRRLEVLALYGDVSQETF